MPNASLTERPLRLLPLACAALALTGCDMIPTGHYRAQSTSMEPSIASGSQFFGWSVRASELQRGAVVLVEKDGLQWIMRLAALPGDRIAMVDGKVVLNGREVSQHSLGTHRFHDGTQSQEHAMFEEQFPGEARPHRILDRGPSAQDNTAEVLLPEGYYYLLGDNRDNSLDSRFEDKGAWTGLGLVEASRITGRVEVQ